MSETVGLSRVTVTFVWCDNATQVVPAAAAADALLEVDLSTAHPLLLC